MLGEFVDDYTVRVVDVFAMPQSGTGVSVEAVDPVFQTKMLDMLKQVGRCVSQQQAGRLTPQQHAGQQAIHTSGGLRGCMLAQHSGCSRASPGDKDSLCS